MPTELTCATFSDKTFALLCNVNTNDHVFDLELLQYLKQQVYTIDFNMSLEEQINNMDMKNIDAIVVLSRQVGQVVLPMLYRKHALNIPVLMFGAGILLQQAPVAWPRDAFTVLVTKQVADSVLPTHYFDYVVDSAAHIPSSVCCVAAAHFPPQLMLGCIHLALSRGQDAAIVAHVQSFCDVAYYCNFTPSPPPPQPKKNHASMVQKYIRYYFAPTAASTYLPKDQRSKVRAAQGISGIVGREHDLHHTVSRVHEQKAYFQNNQPLIEAAYNRLDQTAKTYVNLNSSMCKWQLDNQPPDELTLYEYLLYQAHMLTPVVGNIKRRDMLSMYKTNWLNDEIINAYRQLLLQTYQDTAYIFNSFLYTRLKESGYNAVYLFSKRVHLFSKQVIIFPVHLGNHWVMVALDNQDYTLTMYDSMNGTHDKVLQQLKQYVLDELAYRAGTKRMETSPRQPMDTETYNKLRPKYSNLTVRHAKNIPQQAGAYDCGIYMLLFIHAVVGKKNLAVLPNRPCTRKQIEDIRDRMAWNLLKNTLKWP